METTDELKILKEKVSFYFNEKTYLFLKTKKDFIYNGTISKIGDSFIIFEDRYSGKMYIAFLEIENIEPNNNPKDKDKRWPG